MINQKCYFSFFLKKGTLYHIGQIFHLLTAVIFFIPINSPIKSPQIPLEPIRTVPYNANIGK